jgi:VCBS repeat-containing protein
MTVTNLQNQSYTEQQGQIQLSTQAAVSGGGNYGTGFVQFAVSQNGDAGDILRLTSAANPNASGAVSITGSTVYLGLGASKMIIGSVDSINNGLGGKPLKINFDNATLAGTSPVTNGDFSQGLTGWTSVLTQIDLGVTQIAGWATPEAPTIKYPTQTPGGDDNDHVRGFDLPQVLINAGRLQLQETSMTTTGYGVVHGPAAYSDTFTATAGMVLKFDWTANQVNDDYHVVGYLLNTATGAIQIALQGWGATGGGVGTVSVPSTGSYRFVFVSGTFDATGGTAAGASMYIDNIRVEAPAVLDNVVQSLINQVTYENTSDNPGAPTKTVSVTTKNFAAATTTDTLSIAVTGVNDAPRGATSGTLINGTEDVAYIVSRATLLSGITDPDLDAMSIASLAVSAGTVIANANDTFTITQAQNFNGPVTLSYTVLDGKGASLAATRNLTITPVNDAPAGSPTASLAHGTEDSPYTLNAASLLAGFSDVENDTLSVNAISAINASVVNNGNNTFTINPSANFNGNVTLKYNVTDGKGGNIAAVQTIVVDAVNDAPVANADAANAAEDGQTVTIDVLANDTDIDAGDTRSIASVNQNGTTGAVSIENGKLVYDTAGKFQSLGAGATAIDSFSYTMQDSAGAQQTATVNVTVTGTNDGPSAAADTAAAAEDGSAVEINVLANDTDVDAGDTKTLASVDTQGTLGSVSIVGDKLSYATGTQFQALGAGATATDTFTYTVKDSAGAQSTASVSVTVTGVNDGPVAVDDAAIVLADTTIAIDALGNDTDIDAGDTRILSSVDGSLAAGKAVIVDGKIVYDTAAQFASLGAGATATDSFTYVMKDGAGAESSATVTVTVQGVNDAPVAFSDSATAIEDGAAISIDVLANDADVDAGDTKAIVSVDTSGTVGEVSIADGKLSYNPGASFQNLGAGATATDSFTYTMKDSGGIERTATVTVTITGTNDGPVAVADTANAAEDGGAIAIDVLANDTDVDAGDTKAIVSVDTSATIGTVSIVNGQLFYDAASQFQSLGAGATATDTFSYTMKDGAGVEQSSAVTVTITGVNDGPVAVADTATTTEDAVTTIDVLANDTDVDAGDTRTLVSVDASGTSSQINIADGKLVYASGASFQALGAGVKAIDTFTYSMTDSAGAVSTATVNVEVVGVNDGPVAVADQAQAIEDGSAVTIDVLANDTDIDAGDSKTLVSVNSAGTVGAVSIADGKIVYAQGANFQSLGAGAFATETFSYTMKDSGGVEKTASVNVTVVGVNDGPVAVADTANVNENESIAIKVLANDTDTDTGDTKAIVTVDALSAKGASVAIEQDVVRYTANADAFDLLKKGESLTDTFSYTMRDASGALSTSTVTVKVSGIADGVAIMGTNQPDAGAKALNGTALDEIIYGLNGNDEIYGNDGADQLFGDNGDDLLKGGNGIDRLDGGNGNDTLFGGKGSDVLTGALGNDLFVFENLGTTKDVDTIVDFKRGNDAIKLLDGLSVVSMNTKIDVNADGTLDTELVLSNGNVVDLLGVSSLSNWNVLLLA